jgi:hypothetical protein
LKFDLEKEISVFAKSEKEGEQAKKDGVRKVCQRDGEAVGGELHELEEIS